MSNRTIFKLFMAAVTLAVPTEIALFVSLYLDTKVPAEWVQS